MSGTRREPGRMGPYIDGFGARLLELGYTPGTVRGLLKDAGHLGRWMASEDLEASQLTSASIDAFLFACRTAGHRRVPSARCLSPLLEYLMREGVFVPEAAGPLTPVDELLANYRTWLVVDRGLAAPTVLRYENLARRFLNQRASAVGGRFVDELAGADVIAFLLRECARVSVGAAKGRVAELRSLLRFLYL